jgi:hypothetical protein
MSLLGTFYSFTLVDAVCRNVCKITFLFCYPVTTLNKLFPFVLSDCTLHCLLVFWIHGDEKRGKGVYGTRVDENILD